MKKINCVNCVIVGKKKILFKGGKINDSIQIA